MKFPTAFSPVVGFMGAIPVAQTVAQGVHCSSLSSAFTMKWVFLQTFI